MLVCLLFANHRIIEQTFSCRLHLYSIVFPLISMASLFNKAPQCISWLAASTLWWLPRPSEYVLSTTSPASQQYILPILSPQACMLTEPKLTLWLGVTIVIKVWPFRWVVLNRHGTYQYQSYWIYFVVRLTHRLCVFIITNYNYNIYYRITQFCRLTNCILGSSPHLSAYVKWAVEN